MRSRVADVERHVCSSEFIIESKPDFDPNDTRYSSGKKGVSPEEFLDLIVWLSRRGLYQDFIYDYEYKESLDDCTMTNECYVASSLVESMCEAFNVPAKKIKIPPGFTDDIKEYHRKKIEERAASEGRPVTFQLTVDDIYAVSTGHLIGRPSYED